MRPTSVSKPETLPDESPGPPKMSPQCAAAMAEIQRLDDHHRACQAAFWCWTCRKYEDLLQVLGVQF